MEQITHFKKVMSNYPTGVTIITTYDKKHNPVGLTVNSFGSVSLDPLLILWSIDKTSTSYETFLNSKTFSVHILSDDQSNLCKLFSRKNVNRFTQCEWSKSEWNLPVLSDTLAVLQCETYDKVEAGDHTILIGKVIDLHSNNKQPLLYHNREFGSIPASRE